MKKQSLAVAMVCCVCLSAASQGLGIFTHQSFLGDNWTWEEDNSFDEATQTYSVLGSGTDIFGVFDGMTFVYAEISGSFTITADLAWGDQEVPGGPPTAGNEWKKMGSMVRADGEDQSSPNICALVRNDMAHLLQWREEHTGDTQYTAFAGKAANDTDTIQLRRIGNTFTMLRKTTDGAFRVITTHELALPTTVHVGLAVTSHDPTAAERGLFSNVLIEPIELGIAVTRSFGDSAIVLTPGDSLTAELKVFVEEGKSADLTILETLPAGWSVSSLNASAGQAGSSGHAITWSIPGAGGSETVLTYTAMVGQTSGLQQIEGVLQVGIDIQPISGDAKVFVKSEQAAFGIFDGSADITSPDDPDQLGAEGVASYDSASGIYTVLGSGWDIYGNSDSFHFLYKAVPVDQPVLLKATIYTDPFTGNGEWSKAGLMIRNDLDSMESEVMAAIRADQGLFWQWRTVYGEATNWSNQILANGSGEGQQNGAIAISRVPETNEVTIWFYDAVTGERTSAAMITDVDFPGGMENASEYYVGLAVTAHDAGRMSIGTFSNVVLLVGDITPVEEWMIHE